MAECAWPIDITECAKASGIDPETPEGLLKVESITRQVSQMLSTWSGYAFGGCRTIRPLSPCGSCRPGCCVSGDCIVIHDAAEVTEVRLHGEVVDPAEYHYDPQIGLLCSSSIEWPNRDSRADSVGALEIDTMIGARPDDWALAVATELACELVKSAAGDKNCRLPSKATMISSQGVTIMMSNEELRYSLPSIMAWVGAVNPAKAKLPSRIFSPEARRARALGPRF